MGELNKIGGEFQKKHSAMIKDNLGHIFPYCSCVVVMTAWHLTITL